MSEISYPMTVRTLSEEEGGGYLVEFPDLPGCMADGQTVEEAVHEAEDALKAWLNTARESGIKIPKPSIPSEFSGQTRLRLPKSLHAALAFRANSEKVSFNTLIVALLAQGVKENFSFSRVASKNRNM